MNRFRPQNLPKRLTIKQRLKYGRTENYNWQSRMQWYPAGWKVNQRNIGDQFKKLHYLARHAPAPIQKRWQRTYYNFQLRHFGRTDLATARYLERWSCHAWL